MSESYEVLHDDLKEDRDDQGEESKQTLKTMNKSSNPVVEEPAENSEESAESDKTENDFEIIEECPPKEESDEWLDIIGSGDFNKRVLKAGQGVSSRPQQGNSVTINYKCYDENDSLIEECLNFEIIIGDLDVVQGFDLVIPLMEAEEKAEVLIPSRLAYGALGRPPDVPENCNLRYEIEILDIKDMLEEEPSLTQIMQLGNKKRDRGNFWYGRGEYLNAVHCYQRAITILDGVHDGSESSSEVLQNILDTKIKVHNNMAASQLKLESYDQALKSVDFVLRIQPKNVKALYRKAKILVAIGQADEALIAFRKAADLEPDNKVVQQEIRTVMLKQKLDETRQRAMYKRMFPENSSKSKPYKKWFKPWSIIGAGSCLALALGVAAYKQYFNP